MSTRLKTPYVATAYKGNTINVPANHDFSRYDQTIVVANPTKYITQIDHIAPPNDGRLEEQYKVTVTLPKGSLNEITFGFWARPSEFEVVEETEEDVKLRFTAIATCDWHSSANGIGCTLKKALLAEGVNDYVYDKHTCGEDNATVVVVETADGDLDSIDCHTVPALDYFAEELVGVPESDLIYEYDYAKVIPLNNGRVVVAGNRD